MDDGEGPCGGRRLLRPPSFLELAWSTYQPIKQGRSTNIWVHPSHYDTKLPTFCYPPNPPKISRVSIVQRESDPHILMMTSYPTLLSSWSHYWNQEAIATRRSKKLGQEIWRTLPPLLLLPTRPLALSCAMWLAIACALSPFGLRYHWVAIKVPHHF